MGDFNIGYDNDDKFIQSLGKMGFIQLIHEPICDTGSIIDHIYVNQALKTFDISIELTSVFYSDHDIITLHVSK